MEVGSRVQQPATSYQPSAVSLGPYDSSLPEKLRLELELQPAKRSLLGYESEITSVRMELGFNHIGLEERANSGGLDWTRALQLVEDLCGRCSQANTLAYAQAVEAMSQLIVPPRAAYLRLVVAEMERASSHL